MIDPQITWPSAADSPASHPQNPGCATSWNPRLCPPVVLPLSRCIHRCVSACVRFPVLGNTRNKKRAMLSPKSKRESLYFPDVLSFLLREKLRVFLFGFCEGGLTLPVSSVCVSICVCAIHMYSHKPPAWPGSAGGALEGRARGLRTLKGRGVYSAALKWSVLFPLFYGAFQSQVFHLGCLSGRRVSDPPLTSLPSIPDFGGLLSCYKLFTK